MAHGRTRADKEAAHAREKLGIIETGEDETIIQSVSESQMKSASKRLLI